MRSGACTIDGRLIFLVQPERLGKAAVLSRVNFSAGHQGHKVVLHRRGVVLLGKSGRSLSGARQPDDQSDPLAIIDRYNFTARVKRKPAALVDYLIPHSQTALL